MSGNAQSTGSVGGSIEALKHLKQVETEWEARLGAAKEEGERALARLRAEVEAAVHAARAEADRAREATLQAARVQAQAEADRIVAEGQAAAQAVTRRAPKELAALREKLLDTVLGEFRPSAGKDGE
jgi:vacuolar-type H+-ATPase subunit H